MFTRNRIFVSAVTGELRSARDMVARLLLVDALGCQPVWQDVFGTESGDVCSVLREKIDDCVGVIQLVGRDYGVEPRTPVASFGRVSYTQFEALYAHRRGKKVWYFLLDDDYPRDADIGQPEDLRRLQAEYRRNVEASEHLYYRISSPETMENRLLRLAPKFQAAAKAASRWMVAVTVLLAAILGTAAWLLYALVIAPTADPHTVPDRPRVFASAGYWARDEFVAVRVPETVVGSLLGDDLYTVPLEVRNLTTMQMRMSQLVVINRNAEAAKLLGYDQDTVMTAEHNVHHELEGQSSVTVPVRLNQVLPKLLTVRVFHNLSDSPSEFRLDVGGIPLPVSSPRHLAREQVFAGYDGLVAIRSAVATAREWSADAKLIAAFPGDNAVYIDPDSRLKYHKVDSWVVTFRSPGRSQWFAVVASADKANQDHAGDADPDVHDPAWNAVLPEVVLGFQQALDIANRSSLLTADWDQPRLNPLRLGEQWTYAWSLPYRGPSGLPILIDAVTGDHLVDAHGETKRVKLEPARLR